MSVKIQATLSCAFSPQQAFVIKKNATELYRILKARSCKRSFCSTCKTFTGGCDDSQGVDKCIPMPYPAHQKVNYSYDKITIRDDHYDDVVLEDTNLDLIFEQWSEFGDQVDEKAAEFEKPHEVLECELLLYSMFEASAPFKELIAPYLKDIEYVQQNALAHLRINLDDVPKDKRQPLLEFLSNHGTFRDAKKRGTPLQ